MALPPSAGADHEIVIEHVAVATVLTAYMGIGTVFVLATVMSEYSPFPHLFCPLIANL